MPRLNDETPYATGLKRLRQNRFTEAERAFREAPEQRPGDLRIRRALAQLLWRLGRAEARMEFRRVLDRAPQDREALLGLAAIAQRTGRLAEAQELLTRASHGGDPRALILLSGLCLKCGDGPGADDSARRQNRAVIFNPDLFHRTDDIHFKPGYENRRINVTTSRCCTASDRNVDIARNRHWRGGNPQWACRSSGGHLAENRTDTRQARLRRRSIKPISMSTRFMTDLEGLINAL